MRRLLPLLLVVAGCAQPGASARSAVLASAYPFAWAVSQVVGDGVPVRDLVQGGGDPHDVELTPRQVGAVEQARVVVYLRGFQPAVDDAVAVTSAPGALDLRTPADVHTPAGSAAGPSSAIDPHVWLDPIRMAAIIGAVRERLVALDPARAATYDENSRAATASLRALDGLYRAQLAHCRQLDVVTAHTAFAYLAERYGLRQVGVTGLDPESEPTPGRVADVARLARSLGVTTVFFESKAAPGLAETVAREIGARTAVLDPIESVRAGEDYLTVMRRNAAALHDGLGCA